MAFSVSTVSSGEIVPLDPKWKPLLDEEWIAKLDETAFLAACRSGRVSRSVLRNFVQQQFFYARHFTQYLCALLSNLENESDRALLANNLFEEMGLGGPGEEPHSVIYRRMMAAMGVSPEEGAVMPATRELISSMLESCRDPDPMVGLGALCLGAEAIVPHVYSQVVAGFLASGEPEENLEFFRIHIAGDDEHAVTMRKIIEREVEADPSRLPRLRQAAARVIASRARFFEGVTHEAV